MLMQPTIQRVFLVYSDEKKKYILKQSFHNFLVINFFDLHNSLFWAFLSNLIQVSILGTKK